MKLGVDESGKGDYFGYLVIAGVVADDCEMLRKMGVRDSKTLSDSAAKSLSTRIRNSHDHDIVRISPEKYNQLYDRFGSLNRLLAWGHARVIENMLEKHKIDEIVTDRFGDESFLSEALMEKGRSARLVQKHKGESDLAVAAASVVARAEFLRTLKKLSLDIGYSLPKGAAHVGEAGRELVKKRGPDILGQVAKTHFKITKRILESRPD